MGYFVDVNIIWKSVSILQLHSLRSLPDAESLIRASQGRFMLNISPWKAMLELFLALLPCVCNSVAHVFVADTWKCSFHHRLFCGMMYVLHIYKFGEGAVLLCFQTVEVTCDLLELSD